MRCNERLSKPEIINTGDDVNPHMKFFLKIAIYRGQNFEFFEVCEDVFDNYPFRRKFSIMSPLFGY